MPERIDELLLDEPGEEDMPSNRRMGERRDINNWEKRLFLWGMSVLVLAATSQIFEMNSNFRAAQSMIQVNTTTNYDQAADISSLEKSQNKLAMAQQGQEFRLGNVEDILDIKGRLRERGVKFIK